MHVMWGGTSPRSPTKGSRWQVEYSQVGRPHMPPTIYHLLPFVGGARRTRPTLRFL